MNTENVNISKDIEQVVRKDILLEENGRIFPLWIMTNFKKYILPEIVRIEGKDPCEESVKHELTIYQEFIGKYLDYRSPFKDILLYHGVGSGKTVTAINVYNILYNYTPKWNIFLLISAALENDPWLKDIKNWLTKENYQNRLKNIVFIHYDSPFADREFLDKINTVDSSKPFLFIIDEVHEFIGNVYNNISKKKGKRAQIIYDYIQNEKKENVNNRIMLLSATPAANKSFEFALIFNLLRPGSFPTSENEFDQIYISPNNFASLNENTKNMFQRRIIGLVSYYLGATPDKYASKKTYYKNIIMDSYQEEIYNHYEEIEEKKEKQRRKMMRGVVGDTLSTYSSSTRQTCNFVFPNIDDYVNGRGRPRPSNFKTFEQEIEETDQNIQKKNLLIKKKKELTAYTNAIKKYIDTFLTFLNNIVNTDKKNKHTLADDIKLFKEKYNSKFSLFLSNEKTKSNLFNKLYQCSPKMITVIFNILKSMGPVLIYSNFVEMEGLQILKIYLNFFGFTSYNNNKENFNFNYMEFHGGISQEERDNNKTIFNSVANKHGKLIKIIMISSAGKQGINLSNIRQIHIVEPYWNEARIEQIIGRGIRHCHHKDLPMEERKVNVFRYKMVRKNNKKTADEKLENISRQKFNLLLSFCEAIKEVAVDCELFKAHNMIGSNYSCFKFNEDSLFNDNVGPAYKKNIEYDQRINNGSNSTNSISLKIKVKKINAVKKISENLYSETELFWYYKESGTIYDYKLFFPIGKILLDDLGNEVKINDSYIIDKIISIPTFKLY